MKVVGQTISMVRGDSESIVVSCNNADGTQVPFSDGDTVYFTIKVNTETDAKILQKVTTSFSDGKAVIEINPADTKSLQYNTYVYDVQWTKANGTVTTIIPPSGFAIESEVTYE